MPSLGWDSLFFRFRALNEPSTGQHPSENVPKRVLFTKEAFDGVPHTASHRSLLNRPCAEFRTRSLSTFSAPASACVPPSVASYRLSLAGRADPPPSPASKSSTFWMR
mgnify:CR=1 FL=1